MSLPYFSMVSSCSQCNSNCECGLDINLNIVLNLDLTLMLHFAFNKNLIKSLFFIMDSYYENIFENTGVKITVGSRKSATYFN